MPVYFYDSYAIIEYLNKNQNYKKYFEQAKGITSVLNLMEVYYKLLKDFGEEKAEIVYETLLPIVVNLEDSIIKQAMKFKLKHKISYADCIGYTIALRKGIKFLTGDEDFKRIKNVEFVK